MNLGKVAGNLPFNTQSMVFKSMTVRTFLSSNIHTCNFCSFASILPLPYIRQVLLPHSTGNIKSLSIKHQASSIITIYTYCLLDVNLNNIRTHRAVNPHTQAFINASSPYIHSIIMGISTLDMGFAALGIDPDVGNVRLSIR